MTRPLGPGAANAQWKYTYIMKYGNLGRITAIGLILTGLTACETAGEKETIQPSAAKREQWESAKYKPQTAPGNAWQSVEEPPPEPEPGLGVSKVQLRSKRGERVVEF